MEKFVHEEVRKSLDITIDTEVHKSVIKKLSSEISK
jgi:hypothetical protein